MSEDNEQQQRSIPSDGSYGAGTLAELTIYSRMENGETKEETFTVPYLLINFGHLVSLDALHLILGYRVIKVSKPDQLKDLGLAG